MIDIDQELAAIVNLKQQIHDCTTTQRDQITVLETEMRAIMDPLVVSIQAHERAIRVAVLTDEKSFKGEHGKVTYRKSYPRYSWDNKALEGYAAAGHDELFQFRKETSVDATVMIKAEVIA
ncbi:MAG: hypothetical protein ACXQTE_01360 [Methanosarcinaceae archaeon]